MSFFKKRRRPKPQAKEKQEKKNTHGREMTKEGTFRPVQSFEL